MRLPTASTTGSAKVCLGGAQPPKKQTGPYPFLTIHNCWKLSHHGPRAALKFSAICNMNKCMVLVLIMPNARRQVCPLHPTWGRGKDRLGILLNRQDLHLGWRAQRRILTVTERMSFKRSQ